MTMEKYKKYYGIIIFVIVLFLSIYISFSHLTQKFEELETSKTNLENAQAALADIQNKKDKVERRIKQLRDVIQSCHKNIYSPVESDVESDTLFFTLYNDLIDMIRKNSVKIKSIDYEYNPESDEFVKEGKDKYFVCDLNMELVSNFVNLGKLIQDIYQYPYYMKIINIKVTPYQQDKKVLVTNLNLRLYAHTTPDVSEE